MPVQEPKLKTIKRIPLPKLKMPKRRANQVFRHRGFFPPWAALILLLTIFTRHANAAPGDVDLTFEAEPNDQVRTVAVQSDGKVLIGGRFTQVSGIPRNLIARLHPNGSLDTSFNPRIVGYWVHSIAVQPDGKLILGGTFTRIDGISRNHIARVQADGSLDPTFDPGTGVENSDVEAVVLQPDGKVLVSGDFTGVNGIRRCAIARLNSDGSVDRSFDTGTGAGDNVRCMKLLPDGRVLIGGEFTTDNDIPRKLIARQNPDGS
jgi:uncharacterized delta-60 repeat protein